MRTADLAAFIKAREAARLGKGKDPIIAKYRFCNVIRADDRVTKAIWLWVEDQNYTMNPDLWFAFVVARLFNNPETLKLIGSNVLPFAPERMRSNLQHRKARGLKVFNAAYIVSTNGISMDKIDYVLDVVLKPLWAARNALRPKLLTKGDKNSPTKSLTYETWDSWHGRLQKFRGLGSFMAAQIVADLKYFHPFFNDTLGIPTSAMEDWWTFAASGPGSRRGLNRVMGLPVAQGWNERKWRDTLALLHKAILPKLPASIGTRLTAQDLQNCLCEFDKYERARLGEGEPKQIYTPHEEK